jgi:pentatricopeptide repeat protein
MSSAMSSIAQHQLQSQGKAGSPSPTRFPPLLLRRGYATEMARAAVMQEAELLEDAWRAGVQVPKERVVRALQLSSKCQDMELLGRMVKVSLQLLPSDRTVRNTVLGAYGRLGADAEALAVLREMEQSRLKLLKPNRTTWNALIASYSKTGQRGKALTALDQMQEAGLLPDVITFNSLIKAHVSVGSTADAVSVFSLMKSRRVAPDSITYGTLIEGFLKEGEYQKAMELLRKMEGRRLTPTLSTLTSFIHANVKVGAFDEAQSIFSRIIREGKKPSCITYTVMIEGMVRQGMAEQAYSLFEDITKRLGIIPDAFTYSSLLKGFKDDPKRAWSIYEHLLSSGVRADFHFYSLLIRTQLQVADAATLNELINKALNCGALFPSSVDSNKCQFLLSLLCARPSSAFHAIHTMLQLRAKLPLSQALFRTAYTLIEKHGDEEFQDLKNELEVAARELFDSDQQP